MVEDNILKILNLETHTKYFKLLCESVGVGALILTLREFELCPACGFVILQVKDYTKLFSKINIFFF